MAVLRKPDGCAVAWCAFSRDEVHGETTSYVDTKTVKYKATEKQAEDVGGGVTTETERVGNVGDSEEKYLVSSER
jgi:hypothetical protein